MGSTLRWKPNVSEGKSLPDELKYILDEKIREGGGIEMVMDISLIPYLEGLKDAKVEGAKELIKIIEKHETIVLWLEY